VKQTIVRNTMFIAKAPQSFYFKDVFEAHSIGESMPYTITIDTCSLMTELGKELHMVPCKTTNIKITTPEDYFILKALLDLRESQDIFGM
jgi:2-C-methyl-D-erythritol 4-phosphate cytidylyltransferase